MSEAEPEFLVQPRILALWQTVFIRFGIFTMMDRNHSYSEYNWNFSNLEDAFKEGEMLHRDKVFLFGCIEPQLLSFDGQWKATYIPVVVVIVSPFPPSDKVVIKSVQTESEEITDMENMNMDWVSYVSPREPGSSEERTEPQIFILSYVQREVDSENLELNYVEHFEYCVPYFDNPFKVDETEESTVDIRYQTEAGPIVDVFDSKFDEPKAFTQELIAANVLPRDHKDAFEKFVEEKVEEGKRANREALRRRLQAQEESRTQGKDAAAFEMMRFYKFYPVATPDTPDLSSIKSTFINRYYGNAHQVF